MSVPTIYKDPDSGAILEVVEAKPVTTDEIDSRINETQSHIDHLTAKLNDLKTLRDKVASFDQPAPAPDQSPADTPPPAEPTEPDAPAPQVPNSAPLEMSQPPISA